ncbi:MAG: hypothetical protein Q8P42_06115 [Gallionella sp.]|nr:hypothetical protein [Gallionella sp.]
MMGFGGFRHLSKPPGNMRGQLSKAEWAGGYGAHSSTSGKRTGEGQGEAGIIAYGASYAVGLKRVC